MPLKGVFMAKESRHRHRRDEKKRPTMTLKERRQKKAEKRFNKQEHRMDDVAHIDW